MIDMFVFPNKFSSPALWNISDSRVCPPKTMIFFLVSFSIEITSNKLITETHELGKLLISLSKVDNAH